MKWNDEGMGYDFENELDEMKMNGNRQAKANESTSTRRQQIS